MEVTWIMEGSPLPLNSIYPIHSVNDENGRREDEMLGLKTS